MIKPVSNTRRSLCFSGKLLDASVIFSPENFYVENDTIVVNPANEYIRVDEDPGYGIPPLSSSILRYVHISSPYPVIVLREIEISNVRDICFEPGWQRYDLFPDDLSQSLELWKSSQDEVGELSFPVGNHTPVHLINLFGSRDKFLLKLNLWFAPAGTNCFIHNEHDFIEIHTQVAGIGYMQKFHNNSYDSLFESIGMHPGFSTAQPFCVAGEKGEYIYPWHQYFAETDCVWMAVEYHSAI
ncbi:hypothetical protein [Gibbsiella quercinecans]|uniref:hypothetical protein n=1 Tax=Gibbsiella quercinecans TaxID=929813 RepID=UPI0011C38B9B|nr:hypothetical protein [Gibbsiella quercinecans]